MSFYTYNPPSSRHPNSSRSPAISDRNSGVRAGGRFSYPKNDRTFPRPIGNIVGDTRALYCDGGSEISFDERNEEPTRSTYVTPSSTNLVATADIMNFLFTSIQVQEGCKPLSCSLSALRVNSQSSTGSISQKDRDFASKKLSYYFDQAVLFVNAEDWVNSETCGIRAINIIFSAPGNMIPEIWSQRYAAVILLLISKSVAKDWESVAELEQLFEPDPSDQQSLRWYGICASLLACELFEDDQLDEAESRCQKILANSSHPWPEPPDLQQLLQCEEAYPLVTRQELDIVAYELLALIMAERGDMLEAGFYKSLAAPASPGVKEKKGSNDSLPDPTHRYSELWASIK
ncbi:hypothetical protein TWF506_004364 [Arthrobotrys conoides]|uniref:Uncharacterized protein n=1 Tax=Arthrobotrys conoides TaxID=74498 RepID=A0AAN8NFN6_9PEZI